MKESSVVKIHTYCPRDVADEIRLAIGKSGGGVIGKYQYCAFVTEGHGYFLPMEGANPAIGKVGEVTKAEEVKIEFVCEKDKVQDVIAAIKSVHPYDEIPIDIFPLLDAEQ
jgi:hypothetical protein